MPPPATSPAEALAASGVTIREAGPGDAVAGVVPRWVALPETTEEVAALMRVAAAHDLAVVPAGGGTKLHWGPPPTRCDLLVDTCRLNEIIEHVRRRPGRTCTGRGDGRRRSPARCATRASNSPWTSPSAARPSAARSRPPPPGPAGCRYGTARDLLIGITVVLADGTVARSGGKVVKNVAGYDLGKLFTGSSGHARA